VRVFMAISRCMSLPKMPVIVTVRHISGLRFAGDFVVVVLGIGSCGYLAALCGSNAEKYCGSLIRVGQLFLSVSGWRRREGSIISFWC
jgi:hypothetical protein